MYSIGDMRRLVEPGSLVRECAAMYLDRPSGLLSSSMPTDYHPTPERFHSKGVVFLAFDDGAYSGYWELEPDGPPTALEESPRSMSATEVISWGRQRTPRVLIRPASDPGHYYWPAGIDPPSGGFSELPIWTEDGEF
jgi:hypothetical protein